MKMLIFQKSDRSLAAMGLAELPNNFASAGEKVVAKGKFPVFCGAFSAGELPSPNIDLLRYSAGVLVVKLDVASDLRWKVLKREARKKLRNSNDAAMEALETGGMTPALAMYRNELRAIIAAKPAELTAASNLSAIEAARPAVLNRPIPSR